MQRPHGPAAFLVVMVIVALSMSTATSASRVAEGGSSYRGELLYENNCTVCHDSIVHIRKNHRARSVEDVRGWVARWVGELKLSWTSEEIEDVTHFLVGRYYKFGKSARKSENIRLGSAGEADR